MGGHPAVVVLGHATAPAIGQPTAQYTSTSTAAFSADFTTSSNLLSLVFGSFSLVATSGTDSRKLPQDYGRVCVVPAPEPSLPVEGTSLGLKSCARFWPSATCSSVILASSLLTP